MRRCPSCEGIVYAVDTSVHMIIDGLFFRSHPGRVIEVPDRNVFFLDNDLVGPDIPLSPLSKHRPEPSLKLVAQCVTGARCFPSYLHSIFLYSPRRSLHARQAQAAKRSSLVSATRIFAGVDGAPRIVAVIPLAPDVDAKNVAKGLAGAVGVEDEGSEGIWKIRYVGILLRVDHYAQLYT